MHWKKMENMNKKKRFSNQFKIEKKYEVVNGFKMGKEDDYDGSERIECAGASIFYKE